MKRIYKIEEGKKVCGVCGGLGEYLEVDPTIIRALWLFAILWAGFGLFAYIICAIIFPKKSDVENSDKKDDDN